MSLENVEGIEVRLNIIPFIVALDNQVLFLSIISFGALQGKCRQVIAIS